MSEPTSVNQYILAHADAELARLRDLNSELLEALAVIANAADLEVARAIACSAIALAIVGETDDETRP